MAKFIGGLVSSYDEKAPQNPMNGFLKELIFTRFLGHEDIDNSSVWRDCN